MNKAKDIYNNESKGLLFEESGKILSLENMQEQIIPKDNKVLIQKISSRTQDYKKRSLIIVSNATDSSENKFAIGRIIAIGENVKTLTVGEYVLFGKWSGIDINTDEQKFSIIKEEDIATKIIF